jgi:hypothetical protein
MRRKGARLPVPWGPLAVTAAVFFVVLLLFLPEGGPCSTLVIVVLGYAAFSIFASSVAEAWRNVAPPKTLEGRARLYRDVAARCLRAAEMYPFAGDNLRREARYYEHRMRREMFQIFSRQNGPKFSSSVHEKYHLITGYAEKHGVADSINGFKEFGQ